MKKNLLIATSLVFFACAKEKVKPVSTQSNSAVEVFTSEEAQSLLRFDENHQITEKEAYDMAESAMQVFSSSGSKLKSGTEERSISSSSTLWYAYSNSKLKSGESKKTDSLPLRVFNFTNSQKEAKGFVIVSGDSRMPGVLAFSDKGSIKDTVMNPGLAVYMGLTEAYVKNKLGSFTDEGEATFKNAVSKIEKTLPDSIKKGTASKLKGYSIGFSLPRRVENKVYGNWTLVEEYGPWLKTVWDQKYPFNKMLTPMGCNVDGQPYPRAGCVAIATAQILAFHKWPAAIEGYSYNWDIMTEAPDCGPKAVLTQIRPNYWVQNYDYTNVEKRTTDIATLLKVVGKNVKMNYGCDASGAYPDDVKNWVNTIGYSCGPMDFTQYNLVMHMKYAQPYFITGYAGSNGHAWVIDGYRGMTRTLDYDLVSYFGSMKIASTHVKTTETIVYLHCNWGWHGLNDGYYASNAFNVTAWNGHYYELNGSVALLGFWPQKPIFL